ALPGVLRSAEVPAGKLQGDVLRVLGDGERRSRDEGRGAILPVSAGTVRGLVAVCIMGTIALLTACGAAAADKSSGGLAGSPSESTAPETMPSHPSPPPSPRPPPHPSRCPPTHPRPRAPPHSRPGSWELCRRSPRTSRHRCGAPPGTQDVPW